MDADSISAVSKTGTLIGVELTENTEIFAGVGASAATGGSVRGAIYYFMADDGAA